MNSSSTDTPAQRLASRGWRVRHSAWTLAVIFGFGLLSFIGFVYVAFRVRQKKWWLTAVVFCILSAIAWAIEGPREGAPATTTASKMASAVLFGVWVASLVYAFILNRDYLRWRARQTADNAWYNQEGQQPTGYPVSPAPGGQPLAPPPVLGVDSSDYYAPGTAPGTTPAVPARPQPQPQAAVPTQRVDINTAPDATIAAVPGFDPALAARIVQARAHHGAFTDIDDLTAVVGLQPHQVVRAGPYLSFSTSSRATNPTAPRPAGRILDI